MLYTLSHSPWQCDIIKLLQMLHKGDDLLLFQDGVFAAINSSYFAKVLTDTTASVFALKEDIEARGLTNQISVKIDIINYFDFVNLVIKQTGHISW